MSSVSRIAPERHIEVGDRLAAVVDTRPFRLGDQREPDRRARTTANDQVTEFRRQAAEVETVCVKHSGHIVEGKPQPMSAEFVTKILGRDTLELDLLLKRCICAATQARCGRRLKFNRLLALGADIGSLGEAEDVFGLELMIRIGRRHLPQAGQRYS